MLNWKTTKIWRSLYSVRVRNDATVCMIICWKEK